MRTYRKAAQETITRGFDWSGQLDGESISASQWSIDAGLTHVSSDYADQTTDVVVSGGTEGTSYRLSNTVTTDAGNVYRRSIMVQVVDR